MTLDWSDCMSCPFVNEMGACGSPLCPSEIAVGYTVVRSKSPLVALGRRHRPGVAAYGASADVINSHFRPTKPPVPE
jgi:hypothetical protein